MVQWLRIYLVIQGTWIWSLVGELRSCKLHDMAKKKKGMYKVRGLKKIRIDKGTKMVQQGQKPTQYCKAIIL